MGRKYNNSHNGLNGTVRCIMTHMKRVTQAPSLTPMARAVACEVNALLLSLDEETWRHRRELNGHITLMKHKNPRKFYP